MRRRAADALVGVVVALGLGGCSGDDHVDGSRADDDLPDCADTGCAAEVAAYSDAVAELPGVESLDLSYRKEQITDGAHVTGDITVAADTSCASLEDELGRLLWQSPMPVSTVTLQCYLSGATGSNYDDARYTFLLKDADELTDRWGPRGG